jgi:hypothetical protein
MTDPLLEELKKQTQYLQVIASKTVSIESEIIAARLDRNCERQEKENTPMRKHDKNTIVMAIAIIVIFVIGCVFWYNAGVQHQKSVSVQSVEVLTYSGDHIIDDQTFPVIAGHDTISLSTHSRFYNESNVTLYVIKAI